MFQAMNASTPSNPSSTPSSVYVDSPALISRPVRFAVTPALPTPKPYGCSATVSTPSSSASRWLSNDDSPGSSALSLVGSWAPPARWIRSSAAV
jgi:hypothetical protein